jgi:phosphate transport system substrate-binding protein
MIRLKPIPKFMLIMSLIAGVIFGGRSVYQKISGKAFGSDTGSPVTESVRASYKTILRIHGSTAIGYDCMPEVLRSFLTEQGWTDIKAFGIGGEEALVGGKNKSGKMESIELISNDTGKGFEDLFNNKANIGMASRPLKNDERQKFIGAGLGDIGSASNEQIIALDAVCVIVNNGNPVNRLKKEQVVNVFAGKVSNWNALGNIDAPVTVYMFEKGHGIRDVFEKNLLGTVPIAANVQLCKDSIEMVEKIEKDPNGIGIVSYQYTSSVKSLAVSDTGDNYIFPNRATISNESYLLTRRMYLYVTNNRSNMTENFLSYIYSNSAYEVIDKFFVSRKIVFNAGQVNETISHDAAYTALTKGATKLSFDVRFKSNSSELDNRAVSDLSMSLESLKRGKIILIGFAD